MIVRTTPEGALKCALRDFLREEWTAVKVNVSISSGTVAKRFRKPDAYQD